MGSKATSKEQGKGRHANSVKPFFPWHNTMNYFNVSKKIRIENPKNCGAKVQICNCVTSEKTTMAKQKNCSAKAQIRKCVTSEKTTVVTCGARV